MKKEDKNISRRNFLKIFGAGTVATGLTLAGCKKSEESVIDDYKKQVEPPKGKMTFRTNPKTGDKVSLLGFGMMRLPDTGGKAIGRESDDPIDQEMVNRLVDYAIEHGVNYFDTSPAYCKGMSENSTGIALSRHPRNKYFVATKLSNFSEETWSREESIKMYRNSFKESNFSEETWSREESIKMYRNSFKELRVDYIDYYLLHSVGQGGMERFSARYLDNGMLDFVLAERKAGRIKNLGFSYLNYLDWEWADEINDRNTDAVYLYNELQKRGIPSVIMEPLLGGRLANVPQYLAKEMKQRDPEHSIASWAFRYAGSPEGVLTVLSGMTYMEHLKDNLLSYCPLKPVSEDEKKFLYHIAEELVGVETIPCNDCKYCMPCPYGVDIPGIFVHYNKCKNEGTLPRQVKDETYDKLRRDYLIGLDRAVPKLRQANHCIGCGRCEVHCPQNIRIPRELRKIDEYVEKLKQGTF